MQGPTTSPSYTTSANSAAATARLSVWPAVRPQLREEAKSPASSASPLCDSADLSDLVRALPHDHDVAEAPRQRALHLHLPEVDPLVQALERDGDEEQQQVTAGVEVATFVGCSLVDSWV